MYKLAIIGSGGAGLAAALEAGRAIGNIVLITKSKLGFSNTILAQGGVAANVGRSDSPEAHYRDTLRCGNFKNIPLLARIMVKESGSVIRWLEEAGVSFDRDSSGEYILKSSLGFSFPRILSSGDKTGAAIIGALTGKIRKLNIPVKEHHRVYNIKKVKDRFEIYCNSKKSVKMESEKVILAAGGNSFKEASRRNILTSNCRDATGEIAKIALGLGAKKRNYYSYQFHPLGWIFPKNLRGRPIPETLLSYGALLAHRNGKMRFDSDENRRTLVRKMMDLTKRGGAFLNSAGPHFKLYVKPVIDRMGIDFIKKSFPAFFNMCQMHKIDIFKAPLPIFPTLHYQNGGILINKNAETGVRNLYASGEITGGVHGTGRLMGNSLLDIICFGRIAGRCASYGKNS